MISSSIFPSKLSSDSHLDDSISIPVAFFLRFLQPKAASSRHTGMYGDSAFKGNVVTSMEPDEELVRQTLLGDTRAFEFLVARHQDSVAKYIWRLIPSSEDREEICQDVFVKVYFSLNKFRFDSKFSTWLYKISWRTALTFLRKKRLSMSSIGNELIDEFASGEKDLESVSDEERIRLIIEREIGRLKPDERSIVTLFHLQELGIEEIAEIVEKPAGTIKSILHRVRHKLKTQLKELAEPGQVRTGLNEGVA